MAGHAIFVAMNTIPKPPRRFLAQPGRGSARRFAGTAHFKCLCVLMFSLVLAGCASRQVTDCEAIAGAGWTRLSTPPADAARLLSLQGIPDSDAAIWFGKGPDRVLACNYGVGLVSPGCCSSRAYEFVRAGHGWKPNGVLLSACNVDQ